MKLFYLYRQIAILCVFSSQVLAIKSVDSILVGGTYHMELTTGDVFEGTVEGKNDTSVIIESEGQPYIFKGSLILKYRMIAPPKSLAKSGSASGDGVAEAEIISFDDALERSSSLGRIEVKINNGSTYSGLLASIDTETLRLNIDGSVIPIHREVISQIATVVEKPKKEKTQEKSKKSEGPFDTVVVINPETDEWGKPLEDIVIIGKIKSDKAETIKIQTSDGQIRELSRETVKRVNKHTQSGEIEKITRYGKSLFCPKDMILVDMPPGKPDRPFFKVCIDKYEYPNKKGSSPNGNVSYEEAQKACESLGKRLCTSEEWEWACSGLEGYTYPYGWHFEEKICNTNGVEKLEPSGSRYKCVGKFGIYDMVGNIFEWVTGQDESPMLMGGPYSKCQTASPGVGGSAKPQTGFRCCKSN